MKPTTMTAYGMSVATVFLLPFCLFGLGPSLSGMVQQNWAGISSVGWWAFIYAVVPASTLSVIFFYFGVKRVGPLHTIIYQNISPIITAGVMFLLFDKVPSAVQIGGVFVIFLGVYLTRTS